MDSFATAREPFRFYTRMQLAELTGLKASNLGELVYYIKQVPTASIYQHTLPAAAPVHVPGTAQ